MAEIVSVTQDSSGIEMDAEIATTPVLDVLELARISALLALMSHIP